MKKYKSFVPQYIFGAVEDISWVWESPCPGFGAEKIPPCSKCNKPFSNTEGRWIITLTDGDIYRFHGDCLAELIKGG